MSVNSQDPVSREVMGTVSLGCEAGARGLETWVLPWLAMGLGKSCLLSVPHSPHLHNGEVTYLLFLAGFDQC